jgi:hypothetical protein
MNNTMTEPSEQAFVWASQWITKKIGGSYSLSIWKIIIQSLRQSLCPKDKIVNRECFLKRQTR